MCHRCAILKPLKDLQVSQGSAPGFKSCISCRDARGMSPYPTVSFSQERESGNNHSGRLDRTEKEMV